MALQVCGDFSKAKLDQLRVDYQPNVKLKQNWIEI